MGIEINDDNYFDIAEAIYTFCTLNHGGQTCPMYSILSTSEFSPGPLWNTLRVEKQNHWFFEIDENNVVELNEKLKEYLDTTRD